MLTIEFLGFMVALQDRPRKTLRGLWKQLTGIAAGLHAGRS